jgi:flagellar basal body-associated protein FliL
MADEEQQFDDEREVSTEEVEQGKKFGFLPAVVFQVLKWVLLVIGGIILVVTISVITFNLLFKGKMTESPQSSSPEYKDNKTIYEVFTNIETIRGATSDNPSRAFMATFTINYPKGKVTTQGELISRAQDIHNLILLFLSSRTAEELGPKYYIEIQDALTERINDIMIAKIEAIKIQELSVF